MLKQLYASKLVIFMLLPLFWIFVMHSPVIAKTRRGEGPQCQEDCLETHSVKMKLLSGEYTKKGDKMKYQDTVEDEAASYSRCLTNCRELMPVK